MRRIIQANIDRLKKLIVSETDPTKLVMEQRLLSEEEWKLKSFSVTGKNEPKVF